jgi:L-rhamnose isomerase
MMIAMLEPTALLREAEDSGNLGNRLALMEEFKTLPYGAVWNMFCLKQDTPAGVEWLNDVRHYEEAVLKKRG